MMDFRCSCFIVTTFVLLSLCKSLGFFARRNVHFRSHYGCFDVWMVVLNAEGIALDIHDPPPSNIRNNTSALDRQFLHISFGYEKKGRSTINAISEPKIPIFPGQNPVFDINALNRLGKSQNAVCYGGGPSDRSKTKQTNRSRLRGCQPLLPQGQSEGSDIPLSLPCVTDNSCPYVAFRCNKGHKWNAVSGSPVCFHCPECQASRRVYGIKRNKDGLRGFDRLKVLTAVFQQVKDKGGHCVDLEANYSSMKDSSSRITVQCGKGHQWSATIGNLLLNERWCMECRRQAISMSETDFHATAEVFGGKFLGLASSKSSSNASSLKPNGKNKKTESVQAERVKKTTRKKKVSLQPLLDLPPPFSTEINATIEPVLSSRSRSRWRCAKGHEFYQYLHNIRRNPGGKRECSWCPICRRDGMKFIWKAPSGSYNRPRKTIVIESELDDK